ncbi:MAG: hypothetical protein H0V66_09970 [Bdellovibrionales bacterium]|nr:hypothetical protein [Bdellovibrionales bacterium]
MKKMNPHYYLMKCKKILRLEAETSFASLPLSIREHAFTADEKFQMNQEQANWRVVLFRDEIMEMDEYNEWLATPEAMLEEEDFEYDLTAN